MKRILFQAAFMLLSTTVSAQDVIVKKNGEEIRAKVEEVGEQSIRYRKFTNLTGSPAARSSLSATNREPRI